MGELSTRYYAVRDPDTGDLTFWYRNKKGKLGPWPTTPTPDYGPQLWTRLTRVPGAQDHTVPERLTGKERKEWVRNWYATIRRPWIETVHGEIEREPETCMARFAAIGYRCCVCGKKLADEESRISAIGPECRKAFPESFVVRLRQLVSQHAGASTVAHTP